MSLTLTPHLAAAVYDCLREFPPYKKMKLPPADEVEFHIVVDKLVHGWHTNAAGGGEHVIAISAGGVEHFDTLVRIVAHEMLHVYQAETKTETPNTKHNAAFHVLARRVCRLFDWDYKNFR